MSDKVQNIAQKIYDYFRTLPYCSEVSTSEGLSNVEEGVFFDLDDMFEIHNELMRIIRSEGIYVADFGRYEYLTVGLPYNIPFFFRARYNQGARIYNILEALAHGTFEGECSEDDRNYAINVVRMVEGTGYDCPVLKRQVVRALDSAFRKCCRIKFEPKPETMERCDGWGYIPKVDSETHHNGEF